jgi:two-component system, chemotaxis family, sensor kinase CheA
VDTSKYAELFLTESRDNLSAINHALLELERAPNAGEHVAELFRAVHTVKGMSATMGYTAVAELCHDLETVLDTVRQGTGTVAPELMDAFFLAADALEGSIERAAAGDESGEALMAVRAVIRRFMIVEPTAADPGAAAPSAKAPAKRKRSAKKAAAAASTPPGDAPAARPVAEGILVCVVQTAETPLRGARAFIAVQRAAELGRVTEVIPSVEDLQAERFERDFALRLVTDASDADIERAVRTAGHIEQVLIDRGEPVPGPGAPETMSATAEHKAAVAGPLSPLDAGWASESKQIRQHRHVRIDLQRLDTLMNLIGELVITRGRLVELSSQIAEPGLEETVTQASRLISDLQDGIMASRMVPVWQVFDRFPRLVRDASRALGKQIDFIIEGKDIELDRSMLDELGDPVVHLLRNAIDHGIESPEARVAAGKSAEGRLVLSAGRQRSSVVIRVTDDGKGIDRDRVLERAKARGLVDGGRDSLTDDELFRVISAPGFSTADKVTDMSGRGVGVDAVSSRVRALGGTVEMRTSRGEGTSVTLRLPVTLAIVRALLARIGDETYALPMTHINETVHADAGRLRTLRGREVLVLRDDVLPVVHLRDLVGMPRRDEGGGQIVVLEVADRRAGLVVDELTGQQEIVVKPFDAVRDGLACFSGATILSDGAPALILDVGTLL